MIFKRLNTCYHDMIFVKTLIRKKMKFTAAHWGTYKVSKDEGGGFKLLPFSQDKDPSDIGRGIESAVRHSSRIQKPAVRKGWLEYQNKQENTQRGEDEFVEVSWETAYELISTEIKRVISTNGNESIYAGSYGWASAGRFHHAQSHLRRFLNLIGGYTYSKNTYSYAAAEVIIPHVLGNFYNFLFDTTTWESISENTSLLLAFGGVPLKNGQINQGGVGSHNQRDYLKNASSNGVKFINVSPLKSDLETVNEVEWISIKPNTDVALMLALCYEIYKSGATDRKFIDKYTVGFKKFTKYLNGDTDGVIKNAEWASQITGLSSDAIFDLIKEIKESKRTMISISWSLTRQSHGEQPYWAAIALASIIGDIGKPGGGIGFGYSAMNSIGNHYKKIPAVSLPQGKNSVKKFIPVARISEMLESPGTSFDYNGSKLTYPDIKLIYWVGGNPFHHHQDLNRMIKAWQLPETIISHEWCWNALAKHSDIVLPVTTPLEREDIALAPRDPYMVFMSKIIDPIGMSKSDFEIFSDLAEKFNIRKEYTENRTEKEWIKWIYDESNALQETNHKFPDFDVFKKKGWYKHPKPIDHQILLREFIESPLKNPLDTPSGKIELFSKKIDSFQYSDCVGHPKWYGDKEYLGNASKYKLHLLSNQPKFKLHSQLDQGKVADGEKSDGRAIIEVNIRDAEARDLSEGALVRVFNDRGSCLAVMKISKDIMQGVVNIPTGAWLDPSKSDSISCVHGNPNVLTLDAGTSKLAQGPSSHTCLVEIEQFKEEPPKIKAFNPPKIIKSKRN